MTTHSRFTPSLRKAAALGLLAAAATIAPQAGLAQEYISGTSTDQTVAYRPGNTVYASAASPDVPASAPAGAVMGSTPKTVVHYLENADASKLAAVLASVYGPAAPAGARNISIIADAGTNSLIITAPHAAMDEVMQTVRQLDIQPYQVLIEAVILEVQLGKSDNLGVDWSWKNTNVDFGIRNAAPGVGTIEALAFNGVKQAVIGDQRTLQGVLQALVTDDRTRILATPRLFAANNRAASIQIGDQVPILQSQAASGGAVLMTTYNYQDVGIKLEVTPHINRQRQTVMDIAQEIKAFREVNLPAGINVTNANPIITNRQARTTIMLEDGQAAVIGGLIRTDRVWTENRVPILGDIPILGAAFRSKSNSEQKTELLIFLTTRVITNPAEMRALVEEQRGDATLTEQRSNQLFSDTHGIRSGFRFLDRNVMQ